jgi:predicted nucleotidyltransferase
MSTQDMATEPVPLTKPQLAAITTACRLHQVQGMHVFGSALRAYFDLERELLEITGKPVDLVMADAVRNRFIRADIKATKQLIYEAGP